MSPNTDDAQSYLGFDCDDLSSAAAYRLLNHLFSLPLVSSCHKKAPSSSPTTSAPASNQTKPATASKIDAIVLFTTDWRSLAVKLIDNWVLVIGGRGRLKLVLRDALLHQ